MTTKAGPEKTSTSRVEEVFLRAIERDPAEWRQILDTECANDKALRTEVESLLKNHADSDDFMDSKAAPGKGLLTGFEAATGRDEELALPTDGMIGRYRVLDRLGAGGMGVVYRAEQDRPKRTVALKVLRTGHTSPRMLRRFEFEAEVLGRLLHPGIAQVYEAGVWTHESVTRPFIAMELVRGLNITRHCEENKLGVRERLDLIAKVCDAVQHAHQVGVIHRDLKPGNIMIAEDGQPKLLDFGVARPLQNDLQLTTSMTGLGALIGTLPYMSPEQVLGDPTKIDTRSDVYSMGVILYELLAGKLPHDVRSRSLPEAARIIRDEHPARLSGINRQFRGEIETIVGQALEKDPAVRYQRAADLAEDIRRYLSGLPIQARNASRWYVVHKTIRRHRGWVGAGVAAFMALGAFAIYANLQAQNEKIGRIAVESALREADTQTKVADIQRTVARESEARLATELRVSTIENSRLLSRTGDLASAEKTLWTAHLAAPDSLHTRWALWEMYYQHGIVATVQSHTGIIYSTAVSPDGTLSATAGTDATISLRHTRDLSLIREIKAHTPATWIVGLAFSADGKQLASVGKDRALMIHDVSTGARVLTVYARSPAVKTALSADSTRLAVATDHGSVTIYEFPSLVEIQSFLPAANATSLAYNTDGSVLYVGLRDSSVAAFDPDGRTLFTQPPGKGHGGLGVAALAVNPISGNIITGGRDRMLRSSDGDDGKPLIAVPTANGSVTSIKAFEDGSTIASAGWWKLDLHDAVTMKLKKSFTAPLSISTLNLFRDDRYVLAGLSSGETRIWELSPGGRIDLPGLEGRVSACFSHDGKFLFTGDSTGKIRMWELPTLRHVRTWVAHPGRVMTILAPKFAGGQPWLITGGEEQKMRIWNYQTGTQERELFPVLSESNASIDVSPDGKLLAYVRGSPHGTLAVVDTTSFETVAELAKHKTGYAYIAARFNHDGTRLMATNRSAVTMLWETADFSAPPKLTARKENQEWAIAFSPDGARIAVSSWSKLIYLTDAKTLESAGTLEGHAALVGNIDFCPTNPRLLASISVDGTLRLWDTIEKRNLLLISLGEAAVEGLVVRFSPDGKSLVVTGSYGVAFVLDLEYYDRAIANQVGNAILRVPQTTDALARAAELKTWADQVIAKPWPRLGKYAEQPTARPGTVEASNPK